MPRFRPFRDSGAYVLKDDLARPPGEQVRWLFRDPLPSESARLEDSTGFTSFAAVGVDGSGDDSARVIQPRWHGNGASVAIEALLLLLTDVVGKGPEGQLAYPKSEIDGEDGKPRKATRKDRERFLAQFAQADLIEVGNHLIERARLTEDERGN